MLQQRAPEKKGGGRGGAEGPEEGWKDGRDQIRRELCARERSPDCVQVLEER